jgi:hypothetical protein
MSEKIQTLTAPQKDQIQIVHQIFYDMALETETNLICMQNAEKAAGKLVEEVLEPGYKVTWVPSPEKGEYYYQERMKTFFGNLGLTDSMNVCIRKAFRVEATNLVREGMKTAFSDLIYRRVSRECCNEGYNINVELTRELLTLRSNDRFGARVVLNLTGDLPWAAECSYWARTLPESCGVDLALWITAVHDFFEAAHALWVLPGEIVICKKPIQVTTWSEGRLIEMHWGTD